MSSLIIADIQISSLKRPSQRKGRKKQVNTSTALLGNARKMYKRGGSHVKHHHRSLVYNSVALNPAVPQDCRLSSKCRLHSSPMPVSGGGAWKLSSRLIQEKGQGQPQMLFPHRVFQKCQKRILLRKCVQESYIGYYFNSLISLHFSSNDSNRVHKHTF